MSEIVRDSLKRTVKGSALVFVTVVASMLIWFATRVIVVRVTTVDELGLYSLAIAVASVISALAVLGLQDGSTRYISLFRGDKREQDALRAGRGSLQLAFVSSVIVSAILYLASGWLAHNVFYKPDFEIPLKTISIFPLLYVMTSVLVGIARGYGDIRPRAYYVNIVHPLTFLVALGVCVYMKLPFISILWAFVAAMVVAGIGVFAHCLRNCPPHAIGLIRGGFRRDLLVFSLPLVITAVMSMMFTWTDTLMLGRYLAAGDVGVYNVAVSLVRLLVFVQGAFSFVFMPIAMEMFSKGQTQELKRTYQVITKWIFALTLPLFFVLFFFPEMSITFLFEPRYEVSGTYLSILCIGYMVNVFVGANVMMMMVYGMSRTLMYVSAFGAVLNVLLNYTFIKHLEFGIAGASWATTISFVAVGLVNFILLYRKCGLHPLTASYLRPMLASALVGTALYALSKSLSLHMWMMPFYLILFVIGYLGAVLITRSVDREDLDLMDSIAARLGFDVSRIRSVLERFSA